MKNNLEKEFLRMVSSNHYLVDFIDNVDVRNYISCQFALESRFGTSVLALVYNNYCSMKSPLVRYSVKVGTYDGTWSIYSSLDNCIKDYLLWIFYYRPFQKVFDSVVNYRNFLRDSRYCPENDYLSKIDNIYNQFFNPNN